MEYDPDFARSFMRRTLEITRDYGGPYDATLLLNCLLGLLIVPKEGLLERIPAAPYEELEGWGIRLTSILSPGRCEFGHDHMPDLRQLVRRMRNAVAHFRIDPRVEAGVVQGFVFRDRNGFHAKISLQELRDFVVKLSAHLEGVA